MDWITSVVAPVVLTCGDESVDLKHRTFHEEFVSFSFGRCILASGQRSQYNDAQCMKRKDLPMTLINCHISLT